MNACGLVVEYNPFHNGHLYHLQEARRLTGADCMIAVMSGYFLQRGEPAIIDKFHRTRAAIEAGVDLVLELPYPYAVQSSEWFAKGSVRTLHAAGVSSICFGSESGDADAFIQAYESRNAQAELYQEIFKSHLSNGLSFPEANRAAYKAIGLDQGKVDLSKPNNILGFSYVKEILEQQLNIQPLTITRTNNAYHDTEINGHIASATSIRKTIIEENNLGANAREAITASTANQLLAYKENSGLWHHWENYFSILQYKVIVLSPEELAQFHGVDEGLEYRIKQTAMQANSMNEWISLVKTKRYTWTRLQRAFVHILVDSKKSEMEAAKTYSKAPYIRVLGMNKTGRTYLNSIKKKLELPLITRLYQERNPVIHLEEKAALTYYSVLPPQIRNRLFQQEKHGPLILD